MRGSIGMNKKQYIAVISESLNDCNIRTLDLILRILCECLKKY